MKFLISILISLCLTAFYKVAEAQSDWFEKNVTIGQSLATTKQQAQPAQFTLTVPQNKSGSYLINAGVGVNIVSLSTKSLTSSFTAEFHRNTVTDSVQNNLQLGYKGSFGFVANDDLAYGLTIDPQYSRDFVKKKNSLQSDLLFSWRTLGSGFNWDSPNFNKSGSRYTKISVLAGSQVQDVLSPGTDASTRGLKIRPLASADASLFFLRHLDQGNPLCSVGLSYTQRIAAVNTTSDGEKYSHLFKAIADYYIVAKPVKVSIGAEFLTGSDIYTGLKQQQYFIIGL